MKVLLFWLLRWKVILLFGCATLSTYQSANANAFEIFPDMQVEYELYNDAVSGLKFYSDTPLWYGIYEQKKFSSLTTPAYAHFFEPSLISPEDLLSFKSLYDVDCLVTSVCTFMPFASIDPKLTEQTDYSLDIAVFSNNPNTYWDAPQWMNTLKVAAVATQLVTQFPKLGKFINKIPLLGSIILKGLKFISNNREKVTSVMTNVHSLTEATVISASILEGVCIGLAEAKVEIPKYDDDDRENGTFSVQDCSQYFGTVKDMANELLKTLDTLVDISKKSDVQLVDMKKYNGIISGSAKMSKIPFLESMTVIPVMNQTSITGFFLDEIEELLWKKWFETKSITIYSSGVTRTDIKTQVKGYFLSLSEGRKKLTPTQLEFVEKPIIEFCKTEFGKAWAANTLRQIKKDFKWEKSLFDFVKRMTTLRESVVQTVKSQNWESILASTRMILKEMLVEFVETGGEQLEATASDALEAALKNITPLQVFKAGTAFIEGGDMMWHYVVNPEVVYLHIDKTANNNLTFTRTAPSLLPVRYLSVAKDDVDKVLSTSDTVIRKTYPSDDNIYYISPADSESKLAHFLVASGFRASVENQTVVRNLGDKKALNTLIDDKKGKVFWHSYKYDGDIAKGIGDAPKLGSRNKDNAFSNPSANYMNFWERDLNDDWFVIQPYSNGMYPVLDQYVQNNKLFPSQDVSYLDFSKIYENTFLTHIAEGVYSDATWFQIGNADKDLYANTFNVYVLNNYPESLLPDEKKPSKYSFLKSSCVWSDTRTGVNYLNIATDVLSPYYVAVKSGGAWVDIKENGIPHQRIELNKSLDGTVYVYDYILRAWENTVLKGEPEKFQELLESGKLGNHIISFKLSDIKNSCPFSDVPVNQWYTKPITLLKELEIIKGRSDGSFGLNNPVSRAEFLKMAMLVADSSKKDSDFPQKETSFYDVPKSHWASGYIDAAKTQKIVDGISKAGKLVFEPENVISRAAAAKIAAVAFFGPLKLIKLYQCDFTDVKDNEWYCPYVSTLAEKGIVKGSLSPSVPGKYVFRPGDQMLREEAAEVICRAYSLSPKTKNTALCD